ncbi:MAG: hypothetical protein GF364_13820 [Candidatus Lokiarchaeota archaeon]|nr:hypothetical protein [Candidatus Lokiarchaeota archaeon]
MQVRIDYTTELIYYEKKKIRWGIEEFNIQFGNKSEEYEYSSEEKKQANEFLDYFMNCVDIKHVEILNYFKKEMEKLEKDYPDLIK